VLGPYVRNLNVLRGFEVGPVLDGVHEHFAKGQSNGISLLHGEICYFMNELDQPIGGLAVTASDQLDILWRSGKDLYAFIPNGPGGGQMEHLFKCLHGIGFGEVAEGAFAHGGNHVGWGALRGDDDEPYMGPDGADLA